MSAKWKEWRRHGAPRMLVQWLRSGVPLKWKGPAPPASGEVEEKQSEEIMKELKTLLQDGAFERGKAHVVAPTFLIPKKDGTNRLIHDLRITNKYLAPPRFTLHGAREAAQVTRNSRWLAVLDLRHGYQQVAMEPQARKFLGAKLGKETIVSTVLPFGLNLSPYVFTRLTGWLVREIRKRFQLEAAVYIDDFLLGSDTKEKLEEGIKSVKSFFEELGVIISTKKEIKPAEKVEFIGLTWDATRKMVGVPKTKRSEYRRAVANLLRHAQSKNTWRRVIGKLGFLREAVGPTMRHVRSLLHTVAARHKGPLIEATGEAREDLEWWKETLSHKTELSLETVPVTGSIVTDASDGGLGYIIRTDTQGGQEENKVQKEVSLLRKNTEGHINKKEIEAILKALENHKEELRGKHLIWYSDSVTALAAVRRQGTQKLSKPAWEITKKVLDLTEQEGIKLMARHVPGRLNGAADALSRPGEERTEMEKVIEKVTRKWGPLEEDPCGATRDPTSLLEGLEWAQHRALLFPKTEDVGYVVRHLALCAADVAPQGDPIMWNCMAVLITPLWRGAVWWPEVERMRTDYIHLGRLKLGNVQAWWQRNGHWPDWTASLIPLATRCGQRKQEQNTKELSLDSLYGKRNTDWPRGDIMAEQGMRREA